jgi:Uma2 family endonuclease
MAMALRWTTADLDVLPDDGKRYEIIDGELYVSKQPNWGHQLVGTLIAGALNEWGLLTGVGVANAAPGVILADDTAVAPDVVWVSAARLPLVLEPDGKLHGAPDLAVEILSPGAKNVRRDRTAKLKAYSRFGVREYWIVNWSRQELHVYRREQAVLTLVQTLQSGDQVSSPLLPGFAAPLAQFFAGLAGVVDADDPAD